MTMQLTLRTLAALLRYPDAELRAHVGELRDALRDEQAFLDKLVVMPDDTVDGQPGEPFNILFDPDVDRLARNRAEDVSIHLALQECGVMLVSALASRGRALPAVGWGRCRRLVAGLRWSSPTRLCCQSGSVERRIRDQSPG